MSKIKIFHITELKGKYYDVIFKIVLYDICEIPTKKY